MTINIIKLLSNKDKYNNYYRFIKSHTLTTEADQILKDFDNYFSQHPSEEDINWGNFSTWFRVVQHPMFKQEKQELYQEIFDTLASSPDLEEEELPLLKHFIEKDYATRAADLSLKIAEGQKRDALSGLQGILDSYHSDIGKTSEIDSAIVTDSLDDILDRIEGDGLEWRLNCLNRSIGPVRKGDFIVIGARPDSGKTSMLASEATHMASQLKEGQVVLWFNNEEQGYKVKNRIIQAGIGWDEEQIRDDRETAYKLYDDLIGWDKILIVDKGHMTRSMVKHFLDKYDPGLIIIDQLRKIHGFEKRAANSVSNQEMLANQAREWAKDYAPLLTVHQADGTAEGVMFPNMSQLYESKTGIQGEADAIIMIGRTHEPGKENIRGVGVVKNKMIGGKKTEKSERYGKYEVEILGDIARFQE